MPDMMSMSPEVQAFSQGAPGPDQTEALFKQKFNEMAYGVLYSKFANLAPHVVTFKILEADPEAGSGVGVFILNYEQKPIYVPVVLTDSKLKPLEMFYCKEQNIFLPFTPEWLDEISKTSLGEMGDQGDLPKEVPQDVNIKDLVSPPLNASGRFGFASDEGRWELDSKRLFKEAEYQAKNPTTTEFLSLMRNKAPKVMLDGVKLAFERNPKMLQKFASNYGIQGLTGAMREGYARAQATEKVASVAPGELRILTKEASPDQLKAVFGNRASAAFSAILKEGYAVSDTRSHIEKVAIRVEGPTFLSSPGPEAGWYRLYFTESKPAPYFVVPFPTGPDGSDCRPVRWGDNSHQVNIQYLVISADGKEAWTADDVVGEKLFETAKDVANSRIGKMVNTTARGNTPVVGSYGFFLNVSSRGIEATKPFKVEMVTTEGGTKKLKSEYHDGTYIIDGDPTRKKFNRVTGGSLVFVPNTAKFIEIKKLKKNESAWDYRHKAEKHSIIKDPKVLLRWMNKILSDKGATKVNVKSAGLNEWWIERGSRAYSVTQALQKVASSYSISVEDARGILYDAQQHGNSTAHVMDRTSGGQIKEAFVKLAQPPMQESPMAYQSQPGQQQGLPAMGDPNAMSPQGGMEMQPGMDPMAMQQQAPPPPISPTDLAIGEAIEGLQQQTQMQQQQTQAQMEQLQQQVGMQQQNNDQLVQVLQGIQQRAGELSAATGGQIPPGAEQSPAMAAQALAPVPPEQPPPPPTPMMDEGQTSPEMVAGQINPEMVDQADQFQDQGMFDTAAIGMLAAAPILQDIVSSYVPNLEKGVDNLGRVLLTLWMKEKETKKAVGDEQFISLEEKLRTVFKTLGDVVLSLSHNAVNAQTEADRAQEMMQTEQ